MIHQIMIYSINFTSNKLKKEKLEGLGKNDVV